MIFLNKEVNFTTACFPGLHYAESIRLLYRKTFKDDCIKKISLKHMQLCPQNKGLLNEDFIDFLKEKFSKTNFRLHANARVLNELFIFDASSDYFDCEVKKYRRKLKQINKLLDAKIYTYHAGSIRISKKEMFDNVKRLQDYLKIPVALEGLYPEKYDMENKNHMTTMKDYEDLLNQKVNYVIDLSHLNIVKNKENICDDMVRSLIENDRCLEIHISGNNGFADSHRIITENYWWMDILNKAKLSKNTDVFTEGDFRGLIKK